MKGPAIRGYAGLVACSVAFVVLVVLVLGERAWARLSGTRYVAGLLLLITLTGCSLDVTARGSLFKRSPKPDDVAAAAAATRAAEARADAVQTAELLLRLHAPASTVESLLRDRGMSAAEAQHVVQRALAARPSPWPTPEPFDGGRP